MKTDSLKDLTFEGKLTNMKIWIKKKRIRGNGPKNLSEGKGIYGKISYDSAGRYRCGRGIGRR
jgi:hypothetical protein